VILVLDTPYFVRTDLDCQRRSENRIDWPV